MNQLINNQKAEMTMCSRDIADLTGKRHDHVMADINKMIEWLGDTCPDFSGELPDTYGRPQKVYFLPKRETLILVSGYSIDLRAKIIDRWQELESQQKPKLPQTYAEALLEAGLAEHEESSHAFTQSKFTAKGVEWVAGEYAKSLVRDATKV